MKTLRDYINLIAEQNLISEKVTLNPDGSVPLTQTVNGVTMNAPANAIRTGTGGIVTSSDGRAVTSGTPVEQPAATQPVQPAAAPEPAGVTVTPVAEPGQITTSELPPAQPASAPVQAQPSPPKQWNKGVLGMGSRGQEVIDLQTKLGIQADGAYGPATRDAVIALQKKLGVTPDGAYGPQTRAAHEKMRSGSGAQPATTVANQTAPNQVTQTQQTFNTTQGIAQGRIDPNSLRGQTTIATPQVAPPAGNPSGVGKNATYTADEIAAAKEALKDPQISARDKAFYTSIVSSAQATQTPAPVQAQPAPTRATVAPMPQMPAAGDPRALQAVQDWYNKYGKTHNPDGTPKATQPVREMSKSDAQLLEKMLTIANLR